MKCWCGDDHEPTCPTCDKCGAGISTGFMVFLCPLKDDCEFFPDDAEGQEFVRQNREGWQQVQLNAQ